jgi:hypothetical protein
MPIQTPHPLYEASIDKWKRCRDAYEGEDAVKKEGELYLPKVAPNQTVPEYKSYKARAVYYEAVSRTVDGFVGAISRKPHAVTLPGKMADFEHDVTADGTGLDELIKKISSEVLLLARCGIMVDYSDEKDRAYISVYQAESIISWGDDFVVLMETVYEPNPDDQFSQVAVEQIRQAHMLDGQYTVTLWRKSEDAVTSSEWVLYKETIPKKRGKPIDNLPWFWLTPMGESSGVEKPPLLGLVNVSLSHYRSSADLEHGLHFTALPTLWITGIKSSEPIEVGGGAVITLSDPAAKVGYAEFSGAGLKSIEERMSAKEAQMAALGAAIWSQKKGVEAAETARIRTAGENSLLMGIVSCVEETLTSALQFAAEWMAVSGAIVLKINRDFLDQHLDPQTLVGMVQAVQAGAMSLDTFTYCLQQSEYLPPETEIDDEVAKLTAAAAKKTADSVKLAAASKPVVAAQHPPIAPE